MGDSVISSDVQDSANRAETSRGEAGVAKCSRRQAMALDLSSGNGGSSTTTVDSIACCRRERSIVYSAIVLLNIGNRSKFGDG